MAQRPAFGPLKKAKPTEVAPPAPAASAAPSAPEPKGPQRIQTSIRMEPALWAAINDLATRKRVETGQRVTVHDLLLEGCIHILAINGIKLSR